MENTNFNYSYLENIVYSKQFRNLQDKTQLFYFLPKRQVRTRLTHTIEVKIIAYEIGYKINQHLRNMGNKTIMIDMNLLDAIALAHDIGHTPFGHVGERTIDAIVSKQDKLGGLINDSNSNQMRFKHNFNSFRILEDLNIEDWRVLDGALFHTRLFYKDDCFIYLRNPYDLIESKETKIKKFIFDEHAIPFQNQNKNKMDSLILEGQIVAIADEIAQRVADIGDGIESRYFEKIKSIISNKALNIKSRIELEKLIKRLMIEDVVENSIKLIDSEKPIIKSISGCKHFIFHKKIVKFSSNMENKNHELEDYVNLIMAQSEVVRESDSRSKYIIRQLYKAFINDITLLPDEFIDDYFGKIINKNIFKNAMKALNYMTNVSDITEVKNILKEIQQHHWRVDKNILPQNKVVIDMTLVKKYFSMLLKNNHLNVVPEINCLFDEYIFKIGFYIAGMTNTDACDAYNRIYGH